MLEVSPGDLMVMTIRILVDYYYYYYIFIDYNRFIRTLDERAEGDRPLGFSNTRNRRVPGPPSYMSTPPGLPQWMVKGDIHDNIINAVRVV